MSSQLGVLFGGSDQKKHINSCVSGISSYFVNIGGNIESIRMKTPILNSMLLSALLLSSFSPGQPLKCLDLSACDYTATEGRGRKHPVSTLLSS